jgi:hypothetical protein
VRAALVNFSSPPNTSRSAIAFTTSRASERDSEGIPPEEGTVIPVTIVRMLPNLSPQCAALAPQAPPLEVAIGESKMESVAVVAVAVVAVLVIDERFGNSR